MQKNQQIPMKKATLLVIFSVIWLADFCQTNVYHPFPDSNAVWIQNSDGWYGTACWIYHDQNLYISGDTILSGRSYHKLYLNEYVSEFCSPPNTPFPPFYSFGQYYGAFRQDIPNKKVYLYKEGLAEPDVLAYDYNLNVGDTLPSSCLNPGGAFVFQIDSVLVGNEYNKRFWLTNGWSYNYPALIEGLGGTYGAFGYFENPTNEWDEFLWCVQINNQPVWSYDTSYRCSIITKVGDHEQKINVQAFPNPFSLFTTIKANIELTPATLTMTNIFGQEVRTMVNLYGTEIKVYRNNLPAGIYFLCLKQGKTIISKFKVIIKD